jgi:rhodanese-related sulfurtransferase
MRQPQSHEPPTGQSVQTVSVDELKQMLDRGQAVLVLDVRQPGGYAEMPGGVPGSVRIPPADLVDRYVELPRDRLIVPYCT